MANEVRLVSELLPAEIASQDILGIILFAMNAEDMSIEMCFQVEGLSAQL